VLIVSSCRFRIAYNDRDLRSAHASAEMCGYVEIYRGIYVNLMFAAGDLHNSSSPINLQVNPDRSPAIAMEKKTGSGDSHEGIFPCARHCGRTHKYTQLLVRIPIDNQRFSVPTKMVFLAVSVHRGNLVYRLPVTGKRISYRKLKKGLVRKQVIIKRLIFFCPSNIITPPLH